MSVSLNERKNEYLCKSSICGSKVIARVPELYIITNFGSIVVALNQKSIVIILTPISTFFLFTRMVLMSHRTNDARNFM